MGHVTTRSTAEHVAPVADENVSPVGRLSVTVTASASDGPVFAT